MAFIDFDVKLMKTIENTNKTQSNRWKVYNCPQKPKKLPTDPTTFRPIFLCHDRNAFVNYIQQLLLTQMCEHTNVFPPSFFAYCPAQSCDDIINIRHPILEDAIENTTKPLLTGSDDKEKYFDRITMEH